MKRNIRILSIDGGGIRGIIAGEILVYIEKKLQEYSGNHEAKIADYFDLVAGTSTGGILACIYLCPDEQDSRKPRFTAEQAVDLYLRRGPNIFNASPWKRLLSLGGLSNEIYSEAPLERYLRAYFRDVRLSDLVKPCIITAYEIEKRYAHIFSRNDAQANPEYDFYLRDVARATSAAPIYFQAARITSLAGQSFSLVDGGVYANNPALCAITEACKLFGQNEPLRINDITLLSIGTGIKRKPFEYKNAKEWGAIGWVKPLMHIMMSGMNETTDHEIEILYKTHQCAHQYLRLSPLLQSASGEMDNASPENMKALRETAKQYINQNTERIDQFVRLLL
ncbi:MAG: patatin-like phospholipase family protein [Cytophagaceae bacterium]|nr:patatin-like phospholipase family protein [Cytophagaceae bacterium]MDW8455252.1 patatin-like phospholipase family protein [Cytophagaceae bacterium]